MEQGRSGPHHEVLIVGAGFSGLGAAMALERAGRGNFLVIDRGPEIGGTWRDNTYPGAACDVPSQLYSFSFALNPDWTRTFSSQSEIQGYLRRTAEHSGTLDRHLFNCELLAARWDGADNQWVVRTTRGTFTATMLVTAFGGLCEPKLLDGIDTLDVEVFHTARWNHDIDLRGRRVAIIGTGASAVQIVPYIASVANHLDVYQRTAPWVMPRDDRAFTPAERTANRRIPGYQRAKRGLIYARRELNSIGFCYLPKLLELASRQAGAHLDRQIEDPELKRRLTPTFAMGCKRVLLSDDYYPAIARENVDLVTEPITRINGATVTTADGKVREIDVLILATGFRATDSPSAELITGADGRTLAERWAEDGQQAYKGTTVAGFPNLFMLVGPNTGVGNTSMIYMIESQLNYLLDALRLMDRHYLATVEVHARVQRRYNVELQRRMARTVWSTGCQSWYLDAEGRNSTLWPGFGFLFRALTRRFDLDAYRVTVRADSVD